MRVEKQGPSGGWSTIARATTGADGRFAASFPWRRAGVVRAMALRTPSPPLQIGLIPLLDVRAERDAIASGASVVLRGTVRPAGRVSVLIERRTATGWTRVAIVTTAGARSSFSVRRRLVRRGTYRLTASVVSGVHRVTAPPVTVRVAAGGTRGPSVGGGAATGGVAG